MDDKEEVGRRFLIDNLEALLVALEVERNGRILEIDSPDSTPERRIEATARLDAVLVKWGETLTALKDLRSAP